MRLIITEEKELNKDTQIKMAGLNKGALSFAGLAGLCMIAASLVEHSLTGLVLWVLVLIFLFMSIHFYTKGIKEKSKELEKRESN